MYPKNAASPERIAIGPVVLIADGTVQTSGVSVKVLPFGTTASAGGGTIAYEEGVVHYTPTQAETNYTSFILIAYKASCIPASVTIVTTASAVAGYAGLDWSKINAPTTAVNLSGTNIDVDQVVASVTGAVGSVSALGAGVITAASIAASALNGKGDWNVGKTGYSLTAGTGLGNQTANITGTITNLTNLPAITANWLTAAGLAADAVAEIQSGLATAAALDVVDNFLDTEIADIQSRLPAALIGGRMDSNMQAGATAVISASLLASDAANEIADALLDRADAIETGETPRMAWRHAVAALAGVLSGAATTTVVIKGAGVATTRITATVDADGNRSAVTLA